MTWLLLAGATAVVYAVHGAWSKGVSQRAGALTSTWALFVFALPVMLVYLFATGIPAIGPRFWGVVGVNTVLYVATFTLFLSALRGGDLGITYPLLALTPVFVVPVEWVLLREMPGAAGVAGIALVAAGVYLLHFGERRRGPLAPIAALLHARSARKALAVAVLWSVTGTMDRVAVLDSSPAFYASVMFASVSLVLLPVMWIRARMRAPGGEDAAGGLRSGLGQAGPARLVVHGLLYAVMCIVQFEALRLALASYVLSVKRAGAVLAVLLGWWAFEEEGLRYRLLGSTVTVAGVGVLAVFG